MFDGRWRDSVERGTGPVGRRLVRMGITADMLTASGLVFAVGTAIAVATGHLHLAIPLLAVTGFHDLLDGPVAKAGGTSSVRGAFFDSVADRLADAIVLGGVAWYVVDTHPGHLVLLPFALMAATSLVSYQRAKAESLGLSAKGGIMERAERMILLGVGFLSSLLLVPVLWAILALTCLTAGGRFVRVWRAAEAPLPTSERRHRRVRSAGRLGGHRRSTAPSRWRARRQGELASRAGRTWRERLAREGRSTGRARVGRRHT
ncbi:MAG: CDP-alcohol phosphatidyltransferase family protein [Acidimicrobiales bacterium]|nr:CDP-alcohol phosphatidyltransferase family protein [Acidimicrobiales bacterium]